MNRAEVPDTLRLDWERRVPAVGVHGKPIDLLLLDGSALAVNGAQLHTIIEDNLVLLRRTSVSTVTGVVLNAKLILNMHLCRTLGRRL